MKNLIAVHGKPKKERYFDPAQPKPHEANWFPWLKNELEKRGIPTEVPAMPEPYAPEYAKWREVFEKLTVNDETGLVGHSAGAGFLLRWLSENPSVSIERVVFVAPWHDQNHEYGRFFFDYEIDPAVTERIGRLTIFNSIDDDASIQKSVQLIRDTLPSAHYVELSDYGHFMLGNKMTTVQFPALLDEVIR